MHWLIKPNPNKKQYEEISEAVKKNGGYCCCALEKIDDTRCMCKEFQEQGTIGFCGCGRYYKIPAIGLITLCGSTRFKNTFFLVAKLYEQAGYPVMMPTTWEHTDGDIITPEKKEVLDRVHRIKIERSDAIIVINEGGYIGESTRKEIEWAEELNKKIIYWEDIKNDIL